MPLASQSNPEASKRILQLMDEQKLKVSKLIKRLPRGESESSWAAYLYSMRSRPKNAPVTSQRVEVLAPILGVTPEYILNGNEEDSVKPPPADFDPERAKTALQEFLRGRGWQASQLSSGLMKGEADPVLTMEITSFINDEEPITAAFVERMFARYPNLKQGEWGLEPPKSGQQQENGHASSPRKTASPGKVKPPPDEPPPSAVATVREVRTIALAAPFQIDKGEATIIKDGSDYFVRIPSEVVLAALWQATK